MLGDPVEQVGERARDQTAVFVPIRAASWRRKNEHGTVCKAMMSTAHREQVRAGSKKGS